MPLSLAVYEWYAPQLAGIEKANSVKVSELLLAKYNRDVAVDSFLGYSEKLELNKLGTERHNACINRLYVRSMYPEQGQSARWWHDLVKRIGLGLYRSKGPRPRIGGRRGSSK